MASDDASAEVALLTPRQRRPLGSLASGTPRSSRTTLSVSESNAEQMLPTERRALPWRPVLGIVWTLRTGQSLRASVEEELSKTC